MNKSMPHDVLTSYGQLDPSTRNILLDVRALIFRTVNDHPEIGSILETLKWGQPSYLPARPRIGSTLRLWQSKDNRLPTIFVNCQSDLLEQIREYHPNSFAYSGSRAITLFGKASDFEDEICHVIRLILMYHLRKRTR